MALQKVSIGYAWFFSIWVLPTMVMAQTTNQVDNPNYRRFFLGIDLGQNIIFNLIEGKKNQAFYFEPVFKFVPNERSPVFGFTLGYSKLRRSTPDDKVVAYYENKGLYLKLGIETPFRLLGIKTSSHQTGKAKITVGVSLVLALFDEQAGAKILSDYFGDAILPLKRSNKIAVGNEISLNFYQPINQRWIFNLQLRNGFIWTDFENKADTPYQNIPIISQYVQGMGFNAYKITAGVGFQLFYRLNRVN